MRSEISVSMGLFLLSAGLPAEAQMSQPLSQGDGATTQSIGGTISTLGTDTANHTYTGTVVLKNVNGIVNIGAETDFFTEVTSGSSSKTISTVGGCLVLDGSATVSSVAGSTVATTGKSWCLENYETATTVTLTTPNYSMFLHSTAGVASTTLAPGTALHFHMGNSNAYQD